MEFSLQNKHALVCGSTQGIGNAVAHECARLGANVTLVARNEDSLQKVLGELDTTKDQQHNYIVADFTEPDALAEKLSAYLQTAAPVQILVNNTGGPPGGPITEAETEDFKQAFSQHLICNHILATAVVPGMKSSKYGRIINVISTSVKLPLPGLGVSNTIRGAVANWSKTMANELGPHGITVNNVLPGPTDTQRLQSVLQAKADRQGVSVATITEEALQEVPLRRFAEPKEVAHAVCFLASPLAAFITGINLPVDGGRTGCL